ncbi:hypothetical protein [Pararhodobacter oceanensis]|uniref:hypothetical protein n=1 Tax=Pararhodobacter oceanensis TaxID=2172121 RepID=UPI003A8F8F9A
MPPHVAAAAKAARYNARVFLAPYRDELFTQDAERKQNRDEAEANRIIFRRRDIVGTN